ncbi:MAG: NF038122 family metalloprotease [Xenococcaceae cyanobacterium]
MKTNSSGKFKSLKSLTPLAVLTLGTGIALSANPVKALTFNFNPLFDTSTSEGAAALAGFQEAGDLWSNIFTDDVIINYDIGFDNLGSGIIAQAGSSTEFYSYTNIFNALSADATSADDATAVANLQIDPALDLLINRTSNNPNGAGSATPYLDNNGDANNTTIRITTSNAKALGLTTSATNDATLTFNNQFSYDFDRSDSVITPGTFDFVGVAAHEIGHALGFISGVDILDINSPPVNGPFLDNQFTFVSTLDLFRYSDDSVAVDAIDWTADNRDKYFSIDGGVTQGALFSNGVNFGDGRQASHWKDNLGLGILDPTAAQGELLSITANDIQAFDVIGWDLPQQQLPTSVPEPGTVFGLMALGAGFLLKGNKRCNTPN